MERSSLQATNGNTAISSKRRLLTCSRKRRPQWEAKPGVRDLLTQTVILWKTTFSGHTFSAAFLLISLWFLGTHHHQEDEAAVALTFIGKRLAANGTEVSQLTCAIEQTKFTIQENGAISVFGSTGYRILDDHRLRMMNREAQQNHAQDG